MQPFTILRVRLTVAVPPGVVDGATFCPIFTLVKKKSVKNNPANPPTICNYFTDYMFTDLQSTSHALGLSAGAPYAANCQGPPTYPQGGDVKVQASTTELSDAFAGPPSPVTVTDRDGTMYYFSSSVGSTLPAWIETRNGNKVTFSDQGAGAFSVTDTLGRTELSSSGFAPRNGGTNTLTV